MRKKKSKEKFCPKCGKKLKPDDKYCIGCGYSFEKRKKKKSSSFLIIITIIVFIILWIIIRLITKKPIMPDLSFIKQIFRIGE
jgi:predicted nucleic acid-binding Zn ribbon protein